MHGSTFYSLSEILYFVPEKSSFTYAYIPTRLEIPNPFLHFPLNHAIFFTVKIFNFLKMFIIFFQCGISSQ